MQKTRANSRTFSTLVAYYALVGPLTYFYFYLVFYKLESALTGLAISILFLALFLAISYLVRTYLSKIELNPNFLAVRKKGLFQSFLLASVFSIGNPLLQIFIIRSQGLGYLVGSLSSYPGSVGKILLSLPASLLFFSIVGTLAFVFFQAIPRSFLEGYKFRWVVIPIASMWVVLYGGANIVMGTAPSLGDIGLFGIVFFLIFEKTRNSLGLILGYVILAEEPVWVSLSVLGSSTYMFSLYLKTSWSILALGILVWLWSHDKLFSMRTRSPA